MPTVPMNVLILIATCLVNTNNSDYELGCKEKTDNSVVCYIGNFTAELDNNFKLPFNKQMVTDILLVNCKMDTILPQIFTYFRNILYLKASNSEIKHVFFEKQSRVEKIDLSYNLIAELPSQAFTILIRIIEIDLSYNKIAIIHANAFEGLRKLRKINLSHNNIKIFDIKNVLNLSKIDWSYNKIEHLNNDDHNATFTNLPNVTSLKLTSVKLNAANPTMIGSLLFMSVLPLVHVLL